MKARSTLALPIWHCMGTLQGSLEQNYLFVLLEVSQFSNLSHLLFVFQNWETKLKFFDTFYWGFSTGLNYSHWNSCLRWFMGVKYSQMFIQIKTPRGLEIIARWDSLPISMVLRSEGSLKSEMLSMNQTTISSGGKM